MIYNSKMNCIVNSIHFPSECDCLINFALVAEAFNDKGESYYRLRDGFCFSYVTNVTESGATLSEFEWEGNELFISSDNKSAVIKEAFCTLEKLKFQMKQEFKNTQFDIFLFLDIDDPDLIPSATLKFYKIRKDYHIILENQLELYEQPVLLDSVV